LHILPLLITKCLQAFCIIVIILCLQISLIYTVHSNVSIVSLTDCELFVIKRDALRKVLYFHPEGNFLVCACTYAWLDAKLYAVFKIIFGNFSPGVTFIGTFCVFLVGYNVQVLLSNYLVEHEVWTNCIKHLIKVTYIQNMA